LTDAVGCTPAICICLIVSSDGSSLGQHKHHASLLTLGARSARRLSSSGSTAGRNCYPIIAIIIVIIAGWARQCCVVARDVCKTNQ
jgi:hypothetical protein